MKRRFAGMIGRAAFWGVLAIAAPLAANTYTVTSTADSGTGSLRKAILDANARPGADSINFAVPGAGVHTIAPISELPAVTDALTINGYTQPGSSLNTLSAGDNAVILIEIIGTSSPAGAPGLTLTHDGCTIRGLAVGGFHPTGDAAGGEGLIVDSNGNTIVGNFFGTDPSGKTADGSRENIDLIGNGNRVGGLAAADRNLISGATNGPGIRISGTGNVVEGNLIGTDLSGFDAIPNTGSGIFSYGSNTAIGGSVPAAANTIKFNGNCGVVLYFPITGNAILGNSIAENDIDAHGLGGIDLGYDGVTPNDACDADTGTNGLQNSPTLASAVSKNGGLDVTFSLNSTPSTTFRIEFFASHACDTSGFGQGEFYLGAVNASTNAGCETSATAHLNVCLSDGYMMTATATDPAGNTSEFSACLALVVAPGNRCPRHVLPVDVAPVRPVHPPR